MFGILEAVALPNTGVYQSYDELIQELNGRMEKEGYKIVKARSHRGRPSGGDASSNGIIRCDLVCDRGGRPYKCMATKHKTSTKKTDCPWRAKAVHRKTVGGWVLTVTCDQHNHEPGTPEPPSPEPVQEVDEDAEADETTVTVDADTSAALQVAGVPENFLRLSGDTFHQFKTEYRKMSQAERLGILSHMQLRIAAIYAVQNEDMQRHQRQQAQDKRHKTIEEQRHTASEHQTTMEQRAKGVKRRRTQASQQLDASESIDSPQQQLQDEEEQAHQEAPQPNGHPASVKQATQQTQPQVQRRHVVQQQSVQQQQQQQYQQYRQATQQQQQQQRQAQQQQQQNMMQQPQFQMGRSTEMMFPVPGIDFPEFRHFNGQHEHQKRTQRGRQ